MKKMRIKPIDAFLSWFYTIPGSQQQYLARLFFLCTTDKTEDFALSPEDALVRLKYYITAEDFLLRRLSRLITVCAIFDLILNNRERFETMDRELEAIGRARDNGGKVARLSEKQWERTVASWRKFRSTVLTDKAIYLWLQN